MPTESYEIVGSFNDQRVISLDGERSINLFEYLDPRAKKNKSLLCTSGLTNSNFNFLLATKGFRGQFVFKNTQYVVVGSSVLSIDISGNVAFLGTLALTDIGYVGIDANTFQVIFVDGVKGYIWDINALTFKEITDTSFPTNPLDVCYLDGFFVVIAGTTNNFQLSSFNQGMVWGPAQNRFTTNFIADNKAFTITTSSIGGVSGTNNFETGIPFKFTNMAPGVLPTTTPAINTTDIFYSIKISSTIINVATSYQNAILGIAVIISNDGTDDPSRTILSQGQLQQASVTSHPGTLVACRTLHRRLFLFSQFFTEVWENAGIGTNLPFRRNNTLLMEYGTPAIGSIAVGFDKMFFLSQDRDGLGSVMEVEGTQSSPVSTKALDFKLAQFAALKQISDCRAFLVKENGLIFYRMNFTLANHTYVYNVTLSDPSSEQGRLWHEEETLNGSRHPAQTHAFFNGLNYVGHYSSPILYILDTNVFTNDGEVIPRRRIGKPIGPSAYQRTRIDRFQLDLLQGNIAFLGFEFDHFILGTEFGFQIITDDGKFIITSQGTLESNIQDPVVFLSYSKDGGQTFGAQLVAPMGKVGERHFRTLWRKLGVVPRGQAFVPKIEFFNNGPFIVMGASWSYEFLPE